jgi:hypothetical protein
VRSPATCIILRIVFGIPLSVAGVTYAARTLLILLLGSNLGLTSLQAQNPQQDVEALVVNDEALAKIVGSM